MPIVNFESFGCIFQNFNTLNWWQSFYIPGSLALEVWLREGQQLCPANINQWGSKRLLNWYFFMCTSHDWPYPNSEEKNGRKYNRFILNLIRFQKIKIKQMYRMEKPVAEESPKLLSQILLGAHLSLQEAIKNTS